MFVSAKTLAIECNVSPKTILAKANQMEREGIKVKATIGRPVKINRERFMRKVFPGWEEGDEK